VASNGIKFLPNYGKICQLIQKLNEETHERLKRERMRLLGRNMDVEKE
jgi:hypothetical protein